MRNLHKYILPLAMASLCMGAQAQTVTFDTDDYKAISIYDSWAGSPLNDGRIQPPVAVIPNHLAGPDSETGLQPDTTAYIVGFQRSRYGSNTSGVRVDLKETFRLTKTVRYVHVMVSRPVTDSRLMLITLGKRSERSGQSTDVEQTWSLYSSTIESGRWFDAVFQIKGFSYEDTEQDGIDIYSLVICPDVADRSDMDEDFICYIDQIEVSDEVSPRFATSNYLSTIYPICFDPTTVSQRTDRYLSGVSMTVGSGTAQEWGTDTGMAYNDGVSQGVIFTTQVGATVRPAVNYTGSSMGVATYIDWGQDGEFSYDVEDDGTPSDGSDIASYIGLRVNGTWRDSDGNNVGSGNQVQNTMPTFTISDSATPGLYRMRYKVDWSSLDPAGNSNNSNYIISNGGAITDVMVNVQGTEVTVNASQLNGDVVASTGETLNGYTVTRSEGLRIVMQPAPGFTYEGIKVTYGYNLEGDSLVNENPQYFTTTIPASAFTDDELTLPDSIMAYGEVMIEGLMIQDLTAVDAVDTQVDEEQTPLYDLSGRPANGKDKGIYVRKGHVFYKK